MATNQQKLDNINARANWTYEQMPVYLRNLILAYRGSDGNAAKDFYGKVMDTPQDTVAQLLNTELTSAFDGKKYALRDYILADNANLNRAKVKDAELSTQLAELKALVEAMTVPVVTVEAAPIDYDLLAEKIAAKMPGYKLVPETPAPAPIPTDPPR